MSASEVDEMNADFDVVVWHFSKYVYDQDFKKKKRL